MKQIHVFVLILGSTILMSASIDFANLFNYTTPAPNYINRDNTPIDNQITDEQATLGRVLFYDKNLSSNNTTSCASCHQQEFAFGDPDLASIGFEGGTTGRHSMRLVNARFGEEERFFWDERATNLEDQTTHPIQDHIEMGFSGTNGQDDLNDLITKLSNISYYKELFVLAYGDALITEDRIQKALAQFVRSIQSFDSKYDIGLAAAGNNLNANFNNFTTEENRGKNLFMSNNGARCNTCHNAPNFDIDENSDNNNVIGVIGDPNAVDLTNTRAPSLRDLVNPNGIINGPFMHDGSLTTLLDVINHYDQIIIDPRNNNLDNRLRGGGGGQGGGQGQNLNLSNTDKNDLIAFLTTLTGSDMYTNEKWSNPFAADGSLTIVNGFFEAHHCDGVDIVLGIDTIQIDTFSASNDIIAESTISGGPVLFRANQSITLHEEFEVMSGSTFTAIIEGCSTIE